MRLKLNLSQLLVISLKAIKDDVLNCKTLVSHEMQNHAVQHRLNRSDIVITGLSDKLDDLNEIVKSLGSHFKVEMTPADILDVMYIKTLHAILVKFAQVGKHNKLKPAYFKSKSLKVSDVVGGTDGRRVYMNDNYSTLGNKLLRYCWKLKNYRKSLKLR